MAGTASYEASAPNPTVKLGRAHRVRACPPCYPNGWAHRGLAHNARASSEATGDGINRRRNRAVQVDLDPLVATLLMVDDSQEVLGRTSAYLEHQGYRVVCVQDAFAAAQLMRQQSFQLVILDIQMPLGGEALARLLERFHATPLIYYSAVDDGVGESLAKKSQNASFVSKGLGLRALAREISKRLLIETESLPPRASG